MTVYAKTNHIKMFLRLSHKYCLMDLHCKFGVDCSLPARDIHVATFICAILKINIPKTTIYSWNYVN